MYNQQYQSNIMNIVFLNGKQCWLYLKLVGYKDRIVKQIYHLGLVAKQALTCFRRLANKKFVIVLDYFVKLFNVDICYYLLRHVFYSTLWCHRIKVFFRLTFYLTQKTRARHETRLKLIVPLDPGNIWPFFMW